MLNTPLTGHDTDMTVPQEEDGLSKAKAAWEKTVSYGNKEGDSQKEKLESRTHPEDKWFKDAIKFLEGKRGNTNYEIPMDPKDERHSGNEC